MGVYKDQIQKYVVKYHMTLHNLLSSLTVRALLVLSGMEKVDAAVAAVAVAAVVGIHSY